MSATIQITIDNTHITTIECFDTPIGIKYPKLLQKLIKQNGLQIDHKESFDNYMTEQQIKNIMLDAFTTLNKFFKKTIIDINKIEWNSQTWRNKLHTVFEKLNGEYDSPSKFMVIAPKDIKEAVRIVNRGVHLLELQPTKQEYSFFWNKNYITREPMTDEDYECTEFVYKPGTAYLSYNEVGKDLRDLYEDNLSIEYPRLKNNHYIGPDMEFNFTRSDSVFESNFYQWMVENRLDPHDKKLGIGKFPVGHYSQNFTNDQLDYDSKITGVSIT